MAKKKQPRLSRTQKIMLEVVEIHKDRQHDLTRQQYIKDTKRFVRYCCEKHGAKTLSDCLPFVQEYADFLVEQDYTASTVHTYLAAVASTFSVPLASIEKPKRHIAQFSRGRKADPNAAKKSNLDHPGWEYLVRFQKETGLRRAELKRLKHKNLVYSNGFFYVVIERGKGGKYFLSRIEKYQEEIILPYFEKAKGDERIFDPKLFQNNLNLHHLRATAALDYYNFQLAKLQADPAYRKVLEAEVIAMWNKYNLNKETGKPKHFNRKQIEGYYYLRGDLRKLALAKGLPVRYDRLAVMAVSVFRTSHFRTSVTVENYFLAV